MADRTNHHQVLGCDVGQDSVVIFDSVSGTRRSVANTADALRRALAELVPARGQGPAASDTLLVCEATGGHEASLLSIAWQAGLTAHRADPRKAHNFLLSLRNAGKSDAIDAQGLARYGLERGDRLPRWQPPEPCRQALQGLVRLRADLVDDRADYSRRLKAPGQGIDKRHIQAVVDALSQHIAALEADIDRLIAQNADLADSVAVIQAIPGCGRRTATTLLALMPELGHLNRRQAAALAGVAPHPNDTGQRHRQVHRIPTRPRRQARHQGCPLHRSLGRKPLPPPARPALPSSPRQRQKAHRRHHRHRQEAHHHHQRQAQGSQLKAATTVLMTVICVPRFFDGWS